MGIFRQPAVANLPIAKLLLDRPERMLNLGANTGLDPLQYFLKLIRQPTAGAGPKRDSPIHIPLFEFISLMDTGIACITPNPLLLTMKEFIGSTEVMNVGCRGLYAVNQAVSVIHTNMHLHAKVPLVAFLGLVHFRVSLTFLVLGRAGCGNNRGVNDGALPHHQALLAELCADGIEDHFAQLVALKEMAEAENGALIWQAIRQMESSKAPHRLDLVQGIFHRWITEIVEQLQAVDSKHYRQRVRRIPVLTLGIVLAELPLQLRPGNQAIHFLEEQFPPRLALLVLVFGFGESQLAHAIFQVKGATAKLSQILGIVQRLPS